LPRFLWILNHRLGLKSWCAAHPHKQKYSLWIQGRCDGTDKRRPSQPVTWVQRSAMPEYTVMRFDDHGVPLDEKYRGWRTVLLQMIKSGIIPEERAHRAFGHPNGPASARYRADL